MAVVTYAAFTLLRSAASGKMPAITAAEADA